MDELVSEIDRHGNHIAHLEQPPKRVLLTPAREVVDLLAGNIEDGWRAALKGDTGLSRLARDVEDGRINPYGAAKTLVDNPELLGELIALSRSS
ncbi:MAG: hypothetical protein M5R36_21940 [Deltaproteobacteria bacterium]|nr:hypothetical protein [Deltaproteobacteria bacterium]